MSWPSPRVELRISSDSRRQATFAPTLVGGFFAFTTLIALAAGLSLAWPATALDDIWSMKPNEHSQLVRLGGLASAAFLALACLMAVTCAGCLARRRWGWTLALCLVLINGIATAVRLAQDTRSDGAIGIVLVTLAVIWLTRASVRKQFNR